MLARIWGCRGSMAAPGPRTLRYGGNTSCVEVRASDGEVIVLDAGTGIRELGLRLVAEGVRRVHLLLTHLHMDHIEGLGFFEPLWRPSTEVHVWGPPSPTLSLDERIGRYLSPPLFPIQVSDIPSQCTFHDAPIDPWDIGSTTLLAGAVEHPGPTVGYRLESDGAAFAYIPDHEPARVVKVETASHDWLPGSDVAFGADILVHDAQYTPGEYGDRVAWGHSSFEDAVSFARVCKVDSLVLFHHDPAHDDDEIDAIASAAADRWGRDDGPVPIAAREGMEITVDAEGVSVA